MALGLSECDLDGQGNTVDLDDEFLADGALQVALAVGGEGGSEPTNLIWDFS